MRQRVSAILVIALLGVMPALAQHPTHTTVSPDTLEWAERAVLPGSKLAVVQGDPSKEGPFVNRLKMRAGYKIPAHFHKASENVTVLAGVSGRQPAEEVTSSTQTPMEDPS